MQIKPYLLDLYCSAGGCTKGYQRAGFYVVGVDIKPQPRYCGDAFVRMDAIQTLETLVGGGYITDTTGHKWYLSDFFAVSASPPCQAYSVTSNMPWVGEYPKLIDPIRKLLIRTGKPYVIENVPGAPLIQPVTLCGTMFGLKMFRHRLFETSFFMLGIPHAKHQEQVGKNGFVCMAGHGDAGRGRIPADHRTVAAWKRAARIDWMNRDEMAQAIPPAYTEWIGQRLMEAITC